MDDSYCARELKSHCSISAANLQVMQQLKQKLFNDCSNIEVLNAKSTQWIAMEAEMPHIDVKNVIRLQEEQKTNKKFHKILKNISNMEKKLVHIQNVDKKLKTNRQVYLNEYETKCQMFTKALDFYCHRFKFKIEPQDEEQDGTVWIKINFVSTNQTPSMPIKFHLDKEASTLLGFDAGLLLTSSQQEVLWNRYNETKNILTLICTLRKIALRRLIVD